MVMGKKIFRFYVPFEKDVVLHLNKGAMSLSKNVLNQRARTTDGKMGPDDLSKDEKWSEREQIQQMDPC